MKIEHREQRLLELLERQRDEQCLALLDRAKNESLQLLRAAHQKARDHVHQAAESERRRARAAARSARAELETLRHRHTQQLALELLRDAWQRLPERLARRWADARGRACWIEMSLQAARQHLPLAHWVVSHPPGLGAQERQRLIATITEATSASPELHADAALSGGLIIACDSVTLDASAAGLLHDRDNVGARLLALLEAELFT